MWLSLQIFTNHIAKALWAPLAQCPWLPNLPHAQDALEPWVPAVSAPARPQQGRVTASSPELLGHGLHPAGPTQKSRAPAGLGLLEPVAWQPVWATGALWPVPLVGPGHELLVSLMTCLGAVELSPGFDSLPGWHTDSLALCSPSLREQSCLYLLPVSYVIYVAKAVQENFENVLLGSPYFLNREDILYGH